MVIVAEMLIDNDAEVSFTGFCWKRGVSYYVLGFDWLAQGEGGALEKEEKFRTKPRYLRLL